MIRTDIAVESTRPRLYNGQIHRQLTDEQEERRSVASLKLDKIDFNHTHHIVFESVSQDTLDFLQHGFLAIQVVGMYSSGHVNKPPTIVSTIINSIHKYISIIKDQAQQDESASSTGDHNHNENLRMGDDSRAVIPMSPLMQTTNSLSMFEATSGDGDEEQIATYLNGMSQENVIDMILTKRKLDRAENQLHFLKRTINIAEQHNKKNIPIRTVKRLLGTYGGNFENSRLDEASSPTANGKESNKSKKGGCLII